jgi:hypothetical protein
MNDRIGGVIVNVLNSSAIDRGLGSRWGQAKDDAMDVLLLR